MLTDVRGRHVTTGVTLVVLVALLGTGLLLGVRALTAPVEPAGKAAPSPTASCDQAAVKKGQRVTSRQVRVSVYNAGSRSGLADETMAGLVKRGFTKGEIGNAPDGSKVVRAQVWTTRLPDPAARLVALQLGRAIKVEVKDSDLGPGVDVVVGNAFGRLAKAPRFVVAKRSASICSDGG